MINISRRGFSKIPSHPRKIFFRSSFRIFFPFSPNEVIKMHVQNVGKETIEKSI